MVAVLFLLRFNLIVAKAIHVFRESWGHKWSNYSAIKVFAPLADLACAGTLIMFYIHLCVKVREL